MQPIHFASCNGQPEVIVELIEKFGVNSRAMADVRFFLYSQ